MKPEVAIQSYRKHDVAVDVAVTDLFPEINSTNQVMSKIPKKLESFITFSLINDLAFLK
jgi:hypothetical protein